MKKTLSIVCCLFLMMTAAAAEMGLKTYLTQTKIKSFIVEDLDLTTALERINQLLSEGDSPRKITFVLSPRVKKLSGRATMMLTDIPVVMVLRFLFIQFGPPSDQSKKSAQIKMLVLDNSRLAIALRGEPFPGVPQVTRTVRGNFMRNNKIPFQSLKQIQGEINLSYGTPLPDVKMSFFRKRNGKRTVGILKITGSSAEVKRTIRIISLFFSPSFDRFRVPPSMEPFKAFTRNDFY